jgi:DNA-binding winged helix-turn-helix (wHTH) protein/tetratricopeptide (TPR) repeat protein
VHRKNQSDPGLELDLGRYELRRHGHRVKLERKPMDLLIFLLSRRDQLVSREEIVTKLWRSDLFIDTEPNINNIIRKIRAALGDDPVHPRFLETVVGKGYRFVGPVRVINARYPSSEIPHPAIDSAAPSQAAGWSERTSLAVLPLLLLGKPADDEGICLGFADALITRLGNLPSTEVLPISAVMSLPASAPPFEIGTRLGVRFVLHGALQLSKGQWRLSLELLDTHTQRKLFSRKHDLDPNRISDLEDEISRQIALALNRPMAPLAAQRRPRHSRDPMAYAEFMRGYRLSSSGDPATLEEASKHLSNAIARDPAFSLAHATLSLVCATRHYELDPASEWIERAEFHCRRSLELDSDLPEAHLASAFLLWGPSKNFQHLEAISELKRALALQNNLPQAYNRLGTILAHIGLLDHAREMYERGRPFHPKKAVSHSIVQVYLWNGEFDLARGEIHAWLAENPGNKYPLYFAPHLAMMSGHVKEAKSLLDEALQLLPDEPLFAGLQGVYYAMAGKADRALDCLTRACAIPKSFGHAHHSYYQFACILALLERRDAAFEWLQRSVATGFACWPFILRDPWLKNLRELPAFDVLISSLQAKYPDHLGLL